MNPRHPASPFRVYLAGPTVFLPDALDLAAAKKALCREFGFEGAFPLDNGADLARKTPFEQGLAIYEANRDLMDACHAIVADMTPFRGPSMDVGTAFEMGYMRAQGKYTYGYSNVVHTFEERVRAYNETPLEAYTAGTAIERFDMPDNLMMPGAIVDAGGTCMVSRPVEPGQELRCLANFRTCLYFLRRQLVREGHAFADARPLDSALERA
jgi:nucleoside 2-deoxyribosyltransferase